MRKTILAAALLAGVCSPSVAMTDTEFDASYKQVLDEAIKQGVHPETRCWSNYCQTFMAAQYNDGYGVALKLDYKDGAEAFEFCLGKTNTDRRCAFSTGVVVDQHWDGTVWQVSRKIADHFDDARGSTSF